MIDEKTILELIVDVYKAGIEDGIAYANDMQFLRETEDD